MCIRDSLEIAREDARLVVVEGVDVDARVGLIGHDIVPVSYTHLNNAQNGDFAKTVLMPGDPLRAKFIAETFLENPQLVNNVRGVQGYTGTYKGVRLSVMASGMGIPSIAIYSNELYTQ